MNSLRHNFFSQMTKLTCYTMTTTTLTCQTGSSEAHRWISTVRINSDDIFFVIPAEVGLSLILSFTDHSLLECSLKKQSIITLGQFNKWTRHNDIMVSQIFHHWGKIRQLVPVYYLTSWHWHWHWHWQIQRSRFGGWQWPQPMKYNRKKLLMVRNVIGSSRSES